MTVFLTLTASKNKAVLFYRLVLLVHARQVIIKSVDTAKTAHNAASDHGLHDLIDDRAYKIVPEDAFSIYMSLLKCLLIILKYDSPNTTTI